MTSNIVDLIASGATPEEIRQAVHDTLYVKSAERIDDFRPIVASNFFEAADPVTKGAKAAEKMEKIKNADKMNKQSYADQPQKKVQNDERLKTGENAAGNIEPLTQYKGKKRGAMGHMNPVGVPERPFAGDRRPNAPGGPTLPFDNGTVPNGSGV